jgi:hypothetical protein
MLAEKLTDLAACFEDHRTSGLPMSETQARAFADALKDCAAQADAMSRSGYRADTVVSLPRHPR